MLSWGESRPPRQVLLPGALLVSPGDPGAQRAAPSGARASGCLWSVTERRAGDCPLSGAAHQPGSSPHHSGPSGETLTHTGRLVPGLVVPLPGARPFSWGVLALCSASGARALLPPTSGAPAGPRTHALAAHSRPCRFQYSFQRRTCTRCIHEHTCTHMHTPHIHAHIITCIRAHCTMAHTCSCSTYVHTPEGTRVLSTVAIKSKGKETLDLASVFRAALAHLWPQTQPR